MSPSRGADEQDDDMWGRREPYMGRSLGWGCWPGVLILGVWSLNPAEGHTGKDPRAFSMAEEQS